MFLPSILLRKGVTIQLVGTNQSQSTTEVSYVVISESMENSMESQKNNPFFVITLACEMFILSLIDQFVDL